MIMIEFPADFQNPLSFLMWFVDVSFAIYELHRFLHPMPKTDYLQPEPGWDLPVKKVEEPSVVAP